MKLNNLINILKQNFTTISRLFKFSKGYRVRYITALIISSLSMVRFSFIIGFPIKWVTDSVFSRDWDQLRFHLILTAIILIINSLLLFLEGYLMDSSRILIGNKIKNSLFDSFLRLPSSFFARHHTGDLLSRITNDVKDLEQSISYSLIDTINFLTLGLGSLMFIAILNLELAIICTILSVVAIIFNSIFLTPISRLSSSIKSALANATARYSDIINGIPVIKMFNLMDWVHKKYDKESREILHNGNKLARVNSFQKFINILLDFVFSFGVLALGAYFLYRNKITEGSLLALMRYSSVLVFAFIGVSEELSYITSLLSGSKRVLEIIDTETESQNPQKGTTPEIADNNAIEFQDVHFSYHNNEATLQDINEKINSGETIAIVGASGSGKTTLLRLLMGFYTQDKGEILLYNRNIKDYSLAQLRELVTYIPQSNYLFDSSIRENIKYGDKNASDEEIYLAAERAHAHQFITELENGYDTTVGPGGSLLSGGQRQRIAIARALLKKSPILLMDEATSSLDSRSENEVKRAFAELMEGKTVVIAAHRLSTIQHADKILVFENGRIIESDTHEELMNGNTRYADFFKLQSRILQTD